MPGPLYPGERRFLTIVGFSFGVLMVALIANLGPLLEWFAALFN
jgi:hypothetical protein